MIYVVTANDTYQTWLTSTQQTITVVNAFLQGGNINVNFANVIGSGISLNVTNSAYFGGNVTVNQNATILGALSVTGKQTVTGDEVNSGNLTVNGVFTSLTGNVIVGGNVTVTSAATVASLNVVPGIQASFNQANIGVTTAIAAFGSSNSVGSNLTLSWSTANTAYSRSNTPNAFANIFITSLNVGYSWTQAGNTSLTANATANNIKIVAGTGLLFFSDTQNSSILITDCGTSNVANAANNLVNNMLNFFVPTGGIIQYAGSTEPPGWLFCSGNAVSRATFANLFTTISTTYGSGDGSTTFNVPDMRGRLVVGRDNMGGNAALRITTLSGFNANTLGNTGGNQMLQTHNHGVTDPTHVHSVNDPSHYHTVGVGGGDFVLINNGTLLSPTGYGNGSNPGTLYYAGTTDGASTGISLFAASTGISINNTGTGGSQNIPPAIVLNFIIKT